MMYKKTIIENEKELIAVLGDHQAEGSEIPSLNSVELDLTDGNISLICHDDNFDISKVSVVEFLAAVLKQHNIEVTYSVNKS